MALPAQSATILRRLAVITALLATPAVAAEEIDLLPPTVIFVTSTGFWEDDGTTAPPTGGATAEDAQKRSGYYKLVAIRQPDRTAKVFLQQIALADSTPEVVSSIELEELSAIRPYVSDIRPERVRAGGVQPGLFATVILKTDPASAEPESWTVMIDDLGELRVEKASN